MPFRAVRAAAVFVSAIFVTVAVWNLGGAAYIQAKALLAQILLQRAWSATLNGGGPTPPWPWADTWPVARLSVPDLGVDLIVLAGASGRTLAFGPGHVLGTTEPGSKGVSLIGGHRDSHFQFLRLLAAGMIVRVQDARGTWRDFRVSRVQIHDRESILLPTLTTDRQLILSTCYPFDAVDAGGHRRYLVHANDTEESEI